MYDDPRDPTPYDPHENLTEDSDDALADLEKEFEARKQKLLEERSRKRERAREFRQVERTPSPVRRNKPKPEPRAEVRSASFTSIPSSNSPAEHSILRRQQEPKTSHVFATRFHGNHEQNAERIDYNERQFEFENLPSSKSVAVDTDRPDPVSGEALSRRYFSEDDVSKVLRNVKVLRTAKLLAKVFAPKFEEPAYTNWCFTGIIMHKSDPRTTVNNQKYMMLRVGDFIHSIDVFLFSDAFKKFWKVRVGDVVAILNPKVKKMGSSFNLSLLEDLNNVLELGTLRHFGHCAGKTKLGDNCNNVVDRLKNVLCNYHEESKYKQGSRMELQGSVKPKAPVNRHGQTSQAYMSRGSNVPTYVQYNTAGIQEKDLLYSGGEQYSKDKYDKPVQESEASKMRKRRANEKLRNDLLSSAAPKRLGDLERLGILVPEHLKQTERQNSLRKVRQHAFKGNFLNGLGYDPTHSACLDAGDWKPTESLQELRAISKGKNISLLASKDDKQKLNQRKRTALKILKSNRSPDLPFGPRDKGEKRGNDLGDNQSGRGGQACENFAANEEEGDSDLEISFACDADERHYQDVLAAPSQ